ncbi:MAG TPA: thiamine diphosphokinase [Acidimicrobiaceae bacterium]|nr:thiamine diphosphokinase [Acidimicrobiaceae bacterium]
MRQACPVPPQPDLDPACVWVFDGAPDPPVLPWVVPPDLPPRGRSPVGAPDEPAPTCIVAVDRGLVHATALGFVPDVVVGDLDSVGRADLDRWRKARPDGLLRRHPTDKDASDLDLALEFAGTLGPDRVVVLSGGGGRLDHLLTSVLCLGRPEHARLPLTAYVGKSVVLPIAQGATRELPQLLPLLVAADAWPAAGRRQAPAILTLLAVGGPATLETSGLRWNLTADDTLPAGSSRGLSNEAAPAEPGTVAEPPRVRVLAGTVVAIASRQDARRGSRSRS